MIRTASILVAFAIALSVTQLMAQYSNLQTTLASLQPGTQYQIIFVTDETTTARNSNIAYYNSLVQANVPAALTSFLTSYGGPPASWNAVASTATVNANSNAPSSGLVFNTEGQLIADPAGSLYSSSAPFTSIQYDPYGSDRGVLVWTGSGIDGEASFGLGSSGATSIYGNSSALGSFWIDIGPGILDNVYSLYGLSTPITTVPEPASIILLALASAGVLLRCRR